MLVPKKSQVVRSGTAGKLACRSQTGGESALHPAGPRGQVFAGKVDSSFRLYGSGVKRSPLVRQIHGKRAACPRYIVPAPGEAALEIHVHARIDAFRFNESLMDTLVRRQTFQAMR